MRTILVLACLALLAGCNALATKDPLFSSADEAGAPKLKPGVWAMDVTSDEKCRFDERRPLYGWPSCANGFAVLPGGAVGGYETRDGKLVLAMTPYILAAGDPPIFEMRDSASGQSAQPLLDRYAGMRPTRLDDRGRAIAIRYWTVLCGPPPPSDAKRPDGSQRYGALQPFPGLTMDASENDCTTDSRDAARAAAKASEALTPADNQIGAHWVRAGDAWKLPSM